MHGQRHSTLVHVPKCSLIVCSNRTRANTEPRIPDLGWPAVKVRLNKRTIDEAAYEGPGGCYLWDTEIAGFGLRIYPTGRKSFLITYRSKGRQRFYTLERFGELTVQQARAEALETLGPASASTAVRASLSWVACWDTARSRRRRDMLIWPTNRFGVQLTR